MVHLAHEEGIPALEPQAATANLTSDDLEAILTYCAEHRCDAAGLTCIGCQRHVKAEGYATVDQFVASHSKIAFIENDTELTGKGFRIAEFRNLDEMMWSWSGEAYWFWARRVLRKLRYGIRKAGALADTGSATHAQNPSVLLMSPQIADNIGMAARAMGNFGLDDLRVIEPRDGWPSEKARAVASGAAASTPRRLLRKQMENLGKSQWQEHRDALLLCWYRS